jgi:signal transduction histidine kinase
MTSTTRIVTDGTGRILEASDTAASLLGVKANGAAVIGASLSAFVSGPQRTEFLALLRDLASGGAPIGTSFQLGRGPREVTVDVEAVAESTGDRLEWLIATAAAHVEQDPAAALGAPQLGRLLSRLPIGVVSVTFDLAVEYANPAARVYLGGAEPGALLADPWPSFSVRKFAKRLFSATPPVRQLVESGNGRIMELDGIPPRAQHPALLLLQDVTSRERHRRAEREFVANAAHELRTPIAAIASSVDALEAGAKEDPAERDQFLAHLQRETGRIGRLVEALLLLARVQGTDTVPALRVIPVRPILEDIARGLRPAAGVAVKVECAGDLNVLADDDLLRQAIWNLGANAITHTESGEVSLACRDLGHVAEIEVRDTGNGIAEDAVDHVFDRFYRAERRGTGFGLGLPLAREIVHALGGALTLDSKVGAGTSVRIYVPSARPVAE